MATEKRLTEKHYNGKGYYMKCSGLCHFDGHCANCDELVKIVDRLGEYEDKAKQTVDAVEVVHGQWIEILSGQNSSGYECSICKRIVSVVSDVDLRERVLAKKYPYCHCGAKMDGGADNGL